MLKTIPLLLLFSLLSPAWAAKSVAISTDKASYRKQVKATEDYSYGETIRVQVANNLARDIFFHADKIIPFTSLYVEGRKGGKWSFWRRLHGIAELPARYTSEEWLKTATRLKPGGKFVFEYKIEFHRSYKPFDAEKYRFKLDYCLSLSGPEDWLHREEVSGEIKEKMFETVYSAPFSVR